MVYDNNDEPIYSALDGKPCYCCNSWGTCDNFGEAMCANIDGICYGDFETCWANLGDC
jgi:hypothetical protein